MAKGTARSTVKVEPATTFTSAILTERNRNCCKGREWDAKRSREKTRRGSVSFHSDSFLTLCGHWSVLKRSLSAAHIIPDGNLTRKWRRVPRFGKLITSNLSNLGSIQMAYFKEAVPKSMHYSSRFFLLMCDNSKYHEMNVSAFVILSFSHTIIYPCFRTEQYSFPFAQWTSLNNC